MSEAFVAFIRHGETVLMLKRGNEVADCPAHWDGVFGLGESDDLDAIITRIEESTGIPAAALTVVREGASRRVYLDRGAVDVTPWLFIANTDEVTPRTLYTESAWVDPGKISAQGALFPELETMYGDVASFLYIVKTTIGQETKVAKEMQARLSGTGSLKDIQQEIFSVLHPQGMRGYIFVEASAFHHVEKLIGRAGGRTTPLKNCSRVLPGTSPLGDVTPYLEPKAATAGIEEGDIVEIRVGAFKGERARVTNIAETKEEVTVELFEAAVPIPITVRADQVRVTQRVD